MEVIGTHVRKATCKTCRQSITLVRWEGMKPEYAEEWLHDKPANSNDPRSCQRGPVAQPMCAFPGCTLVEHPGDDFHFGVQ